jgi:uncharacterized protein YfaS (alpha-2-macroglobulin family)
MDLDQTKTPDTTQSEGALVTRRSARPGLRRSAWACALLVLIMGWAGARNVGDVVSESLVREPKRFTEMYFADHTRLPKVLIAGEDSRFGFVIANHEGRPVDYRFMVSAESPSGTITLGQGRVRVDEGHRTTEEISFAPPRPATTYLISVRLPGRPEQIHFLGQS